MPALTPHHQPLTVGRECHGADVAVRADADGPAPRGARPVPEQHCWRIEERPTRAGTVAPGRRAMALVASLGAFLIAPLASFPRCSRPGRSATSRVATPAACGEARCAPDPERREGQGDAGGLPRGLHLLPKRSAAILATGKHENRNILDRVASGSVIPRTRRPRPVHRRDRPR